MIQQCLMKKNIQRISTLCPDYDYKKIGKNFFEYTFSKLNTGLGLGGMFDLAPSAAKGRLGSDLIEIQDETKEFLGKIVDSATPGPIKIMRGDLIGAAFTGGTSGTGGTVRQNQLMFDWEADPNAANIPQAKTGGLFRILPRITRRAKNQVTRPKQTY